MLQNTWHELSISFAWHKRFKEGKESVRNDERCGRSKVVNTPEGYYVKVLREFRKIFHRKRPHSSNRVSGISTRSMHQSTTPSLSQTIWPRWASRQFLTLPTVQTLLPMTVGYSLSSEALVMRQLRRLGRGSLTGSHKKTSMGLFRSCWNGTTSALQP